VLFKTKEKPVAKKKSSNKVDSVKKDTKTQAPRQISPKAVKAIEDFCNHHGIDIPETDEFNLLHFLSGMTERASALSKAMKAVDEAVQAIIRVGRDDDGVLDFAQSCPTCGSDVIVEYHSCPVCGEHLLVGDVVELDDKDLEFKDKLKENKSSKKSKEVEEDLDDEDEDDKKSKKKSSKKSKEVEEDLDDDSDDEDDKKSKKKSSKKSKEDEDDLDDEDGFGVDWDSDDDDDSDDEDDKKSKKKSSKKSKEVEEDDSDDDDDFFSDDDDDSDDEDDKKSKKKSSKKSKEDEDDDDFEIDDDSDDEDEDDKKSKKKTSDIPAKKSKEDKSAQVKELLAKLKKNPKLAEKLKRQELTQIGFSIGIKQPLKMKNDELVKAVQKHLKK
jgi:hypothetical protein